MSLWQVILQYNLLTLATLGNTAQIKITVISSHLPRMPRHSYKPLLRQWFYSTVYFIGGLGNMTQIKATVFVSRLPRKLRQPQKCHCGRWYYSTTYLPWPPLATRHEHKLPYWCYVSQGSHGNHRNVIVARWYYSTTYFPWPLWSTQHKRNHYICVTSPKEAKASPETASATINLTVLPTYLDNLRWQNTNKKHCFCVMSPKEPKVIRESISVTSDFIVACEKLRQCTLALMKTCAYYF